MRNSRLAFALLFAMAGACFAKDGGTIGGLTTDQTGGAVPGATVVAKNIDTGLTQTAKTESDGVYVFLYLPAGNYTVTTEKAGFRKSEVTGVEVHVATVSSID